MGFLSVPVVLLNGDPSVSAVSQSATTQINVVIDPVISVSTPKSMEINISPTISGKFESKTENVTVTTNSTKGYTAYITSDTSNTALKQPTSTGVSAVIPTISTTGTSISGTGWGWSNDATQFKPVQVAGATNANAVFSKTTTASPTGDTKTLTIGASATNSVPEGTYSNTLLLTAITNN